MIPRPPVRFLMDGLQERLSKEMLASINFGDDPQHGWSEGYRSDAWVDPITKTAMLLPAPMDSSFYTNGTGINARLGKSDFTLATPASWEEHKVLHSADTYLVNLDVNEVAVSSASYSKNRGIWLSWFPHFTTQDAAESITVGWGNGASTDTKLTFYSDGRTEVYRDNFLVGVYSINAKRTGDQTLVSMGSKFAGVMLIPCRHRELVVVTLDGGGFSHVFDDIEESDSDPIITAAGTIFFNVSAGQATVQLAPLSFKSSGNIAGKKTIWREAPDSGDTFTVDVIYDDPNTGGAYTATGAVREEDDTAAFTPNGVKTESRTRVSMTGDGTSSPFVYATTAIRDPQTDDTDDSEEIVFTDYVVSAKISVPEDGSPADLALRCRDPRALETAGADRPDYMARRAIQFQVDDGASGWYTQFDGRNDAPDFDESAVRETDYFDFTAHNRFEMLDRYRFRDELPLWGKTYKEALEDVCKYAGMPAADLDIEDAGINLATTGAPTDGDWGERIDVGDTAGKVVRELNERYAGLWIHGEYPTTTGVKLRFRSEADLGDTPDVTLYATRAAAETAADTAGFTDADEKRVVGSQYVYKEYKEVVIEPEANDIWVTGMDPRTKRPIVVNKADTAAQDVTTIPSSRPDNWTGEILPFGYLTDALTSEEACLVALNAIFERITGRRKLAEWTCPLLFKDDRTLVWRGDVIDLAGRGKYRVFAAELELASDGAFLTGFPIARAPSRYVGYWIGESDS